MNQNPTKCGRFVATGRSPVPYLTMVAVLFSLAGPAAAALVAGPDIIPAPPSVINNAPGAENTAQQAFNEQQGVVLPAALAVDLPVGFIAAGTVVDSHMIFLNTDTPGATSDLGVVWTFDGTVLGVMSDGAGTLEAASNALLGAVGTTYPGSFPARGMEGSDSYVIAANTITVNMTVSEPGDWIRVVTESPCDPNPRTQGYWHRQCLGAGLILPGRNGRGPQFPNEPDFDKLLPDVDAALFDTIFEPRACEDGIQTDPPSDQCEKAKKQFTALLFNLHSGRLSDGCTVTAAECSSTTVGEAIDEIAALINSGDSGNCNAAKACAAAINEGAVTEISSLETPMSSDAATVSTRPAFRSTGGVGETSVSTVDVEAATPPPDASSVILLEGEARDTEVEQPVEPEIVETDDLLGSLKRHAAVLSNASAPEAALRVSEDALLTILSGGYEPEVRIEVIGVLVDHVDVALHDLLIRHLEDLRDEAQDFEKDELAAQADRLLQRLASDQE